MGLKNKFIWIQCFLLLAVCGVLGSIGFSNPPKVYINEIVACNQHVIYDSLGNFPDYIELYNASSQPIDISGWALSDSKKNLKKYVFPKGTMISPYQYKMLWAGPWPAELFSKTELPYTGFSIHNGEKIYFSDAKGKVIDKIIVPATLPCDQSYARLPYGGKGIREPSPGAQNPLARKKDVKMISDVKVRLSRSSGFYESPFQLEMTAPDGFDIYYTLDATYPDQHALKYTSPLLIQDASQNPNKYAAIDTIRPNQVYIPQFLLDKATIVRAVAIRRRDGARTPIANATYFVNFNTKKGYKNIPIISMIVNPEDLFDYEKGIYVNGKIATLNEGVRIFEPVGNYAMHGSGWKRPAFIESFGDNPAGWFGNYDIGMQGNFSVQNEQKGFRILSKTPPMGKEYILRAGTDDKHSTKIREWLIQKLSKGRKIKTADVGFAILFLNGEYWGIYDLQEAVSLHNVAKTYGIDPSNLVIYKKYHPVNFLTRTHKIMPKELADKIDFPEYFEMGTDLSPQATYDRLNKEVDIDSLIDYACINLYIANRDWLETNLTRYRTLTKGNEAEQDTRWRYILADVDSSSGIGVWDGLFELGRPSLGPIPPFINSFFRGNFNAQLDEIPTFKKLVQNEEFKRKFVTAFQDIANYNFTPKKVNAFLDNVLAQHLENMPLSFRRFMRSDYTEQDYINEIDLIRDFFEKRFDGIMPHLKNYFHLQGDLVNIHKIPSAVRGGQILLNTLTLNADEDYQGRYYSDYPISLGVKTKAGYTFMGWRIDDTWIESPTLELNLSAPKKIEAVWRIVGKNDHE